MPKLLSRIAALLLVPGLIADPALAVSLNTPLVPLVYRSAFDSQAMACASALPLANHFSDASTQVTAHIAVAARPPALPPAAEVIPAIKALLSTYFTAGAELNGALSLFGDYLAGSPLLLFPFEKLMARLLAERNGRPFSRRNLRDLLEWLRGLKDWAQMGPAQMQERFADPEEALVRTVIGKRFDRFAFWVEMFRGFETGANPPSERWEDIQPELSPTAWEDGRRPRKRRYHSQFVAPRSTLTPMPIRRNDRFELLISHESPRSFPEGSRRILLRVRGRSLIEKLKTAQKQIREPTSSFVYTIVVGRSGDSLLVYEHQPLMSIDPALEAEFPEVALAIRAANDEWPDLLSSRARALAAAGWPDQPVTVRNLQLVSTGFIMRRWPGLSGETGMRSYTDFPRAKGFEPVEQGPSAGAPALGGIWGWRKPILPTVFRNGSHSPATSA